MSSQRKWSEADVLDQSGRIAVVTGSNTGIGYHAVAVLGPVVFQSAAMGALPTLRAATDPDVEGGPYYGPDGIGQRRGHPKLVSSSAQSHDEESQRRLRTVSEELTGVTFGV